MLLMTWIERARDAFRRAGRVVVAFAKNDVTHYVIGALIVILALGVVIQHGCDAHRSSSTDDVIVVPPDGGRAQREIENQLDAAVALHDQQVRVIEERVVIRRVEHERQLRDVEQRVVSQGRDSVATWLSDFDRTIGDGGVR